MKKLIVLGLLLVSFVSFGQGMTEKEKEEFKTEMKEKFQALKLSDDQKSKFEDIQMKYFDQMVAIRDSDAGRMSKMKSLKAIQKSKNEEVKAIMNEQQFEQYLELQKELRQTMKEEYKARKQG